LTELKKKQTPSKKPQTAKHLNLSTSLCTAPLARVPRTKHMTSFTLLFTSTRFKELHWTDSNF